MNIKKECPNCKRKLRTRCFVFNRVVKEEICRTCDKKIGSNPFYTKKKETIGKYNMTATEKKVLANKKGWKAVNSECLGLQKIKKRESKRKRLSRRRFKIKESENKELNKKFVEGLK